MSRDHLIKNIQMDPGVIQAKSDLIANATNITERTKNYLKWCIIRDTFMWIANHFHERDCVGEIIQCRTKDCMINMGIALQLHSAIKSRERDCL